MHEIDLIPAEYRFRQQLLRWITVVIAVGIGVVFINAAGFGYFLHQTSEIESEIEQLQAQKAISTQQRSELKELQTRKEELEKQWQLLTGLRSGSAVGEVFRTIDRALAEEDVWFLSWEFRRAGSVRKAGQKTVNTGYFIVLPAGKEGGEEETWQIETHMTIRGQAMDHAALSNFVTRLVSQPEIHAVRVLNTALRTQGGAKLVDFSLAVVVAGNEAHG
jgi:Tfp pilus assembly protein PilN